MSLIGAAAGAAMRRRIGLGPSDIRAVRAVFKRKAKPLNKRQKQQVKRIIHGDAELKYFTKNSADAGAYAQVDRAGTLTSLMDIPQGDTVSTRDGDTIRCAKLDLRLSAYYNAAAISTDVGHKLRVCIFKWNITTGVNAPSSLQIFENQGGIGNYQAIVSPISYQLTEENDITMLYDRTFSLNHSNDIALHKIFNLKNYKITFDQGATTGPHKLYMQLYADDATGAHTPDIQVTWTSRLYFHDV